VLSLIMCRNLLKCFGRKVKFAMCENKKNSVSIRNFFFIFLVAFDVFQTVIAARMDYTYGAGSEFSDNAGLVSVDEVNDTIIKTFVGGSYYEDSAAVNSDVRLMLENSNYVNDTFADQLFLSLSADVNWTIRPSSFFWSLENYFLQAERDVLDVATPNNLINTNAFSTGPDFIFRIDSVHSLLLSTRLSSYKFEDSNANSNRGSMLASWKHDLSAESEISLNATFMDVKYEDLEDIADFSRNDIFVNFNMQYFESSIDLSIGKTFINREIDGDIDGGLAKFIWINQFRSQSYFRVDLISKYSDSGIDLLNTDASGLSLNVSGGQVNADIFYDKRLNARYHINSGFSGFNIYFTYRDEDYEILLRDRNIKLAGLNYNYAYTTRIQLIADAYFSKIDNIDADQLDDLTVFNMFLNYRISRNVSFSSGYRFSEQASNVETSEFTENRVMFSLYYGRNIQSYR